MPKWEIYPLHVGTIHRKRSSFLYIVGGPEPLEVPVTAFLLRSGDDFALVDTGGDDPATTYEEHHPYQRLPEQHPLAAIRALGVDPRSISLVINTHLHWDHCCGNDLFPWARFVVQREELRYAAAPLPCHARGYSSFLIGRVPTWASTQFQLLDGDTELMPGLRALFTPGHTPGSMSLLVEAESGLYLLPGDNIPLYENWEGKPPHWPHIPDTLHYDLSDYFETFRKMEATVARVIPTHDFKVFDTAVYR